MEKGGIKSFLQEAGEISKFTGRNESMPTLFQ
jgi:hypothetical protein